MASEEPEVVMSCLIYNGLDHTRDEIAQLVNEEYGTDLSEGSVSRIINGVEAEASSGDEKRVYMKYVMRGAMAEAALDVTNDLGDILGW